MLEPRLYDRLQTKKQQLDALRPLPTSTVQRLREQVNIEWIYNSNAIEGSTLTLRETMLILETGLTIGGKSLREHFEVLNHRDAIEYVESLAVTDVILSPLHVREIHQFVLKGIDDENAGQYRRLLVRIAGARHQPPEAWQVPALMDEWVNWLRNESSDFHPVPRAAMLHHRLVSIHPFIDGNGRTARLVMNLMLMQAGYPPTIILRINRRQYYQALVRADSGDLRPFINFVGRAVERSLTLYLEACTPLSEPVAVRDVWIPLAEAARDTPYSQEYLSLLARKGRLEAVKRGRVWYTTRQAVETYIKSVH